MQAINDYLNDTHQLLALLVDARPGKLINLRSNIIGNTDVELKGSSLPENPVCFTLQRDSIVAVTLEAAGAENVIFSALDFLNEITDIVCHSEDRRPVFRAITRLPAGEHALTIRCRPAETAHASVYGPVRLEVWRYPASLTTWRHTLNDRDPASWIGSALLECADHAQPCLRGSTNQHDPAMLAEAIRAIAASSYA